MKKLIWLPIAGFLLIAGAAVAAAAPTLLNPSQPAPAAAASPAASPDASTAPTTDQQQFKDPLLAKVLADLVAKGTITQAQADAITSGVQTEIDARKAEMEKLRQQWQQTREQLHTFLQDGVITQDEIDTLPADNPLRQAFDSIAQNGQVTLDQLQQFLPFDGPMGRPGFGPGFGFGDHRFGGWPGGTDTDNQGPSATSAP
jgi:membrane-bound lytic murein transglycosylase B